MRILSLLSGLSGPRDLGSRSRGRPEDDGGYPCIYEWARPASYTDVRRFVGLANYYRKFVKGFATVAAPLTGLCSPRASFRWDQVEQASFDALKAALTSALVLRV